MSNLRFVFFTMAGFALIIFVVKLGTDAGAKSIVGEGPWPSRSAMEQADQERRAADFDSPAWTGRTVSTEAREAEAARRVLEREAIIEAARQRSAEGASDPYYE